MNDAAIMGMLQGLADFNSELSGFSPVEATTRIEFLLQAVSLD